MSRSPKETFASGLRPESQATDIDAQLQSERVWTICGVALAIAVAVGALNEVWRNDGTPKIYGASHLALFAQPARLRDRIETLAPASDKAQDAPAPATMGPAALSSTVDFEPTATISRSAASDMEGDLVAIGPPDLLYVERAQGVFRTASGRQALRLGDSAPGGGTIRAFKRRDGHWVAMVARAQTSR